MTGESNGHAEKSKIMIPEVKFTKLFINGEFVDSISGNLSFYFLLYIIFCFFVLENITSKQYISNSTEKDFLSRLKNIGHKTSMIHVLIRFCVANGLLTFSLNTASFFVSHIVAVLKNSGCKV